MNISSRDLVFLLLLAIALVFMLGAVQKMRQTEVVLTIEPGRMTDIIQKCYKVDLSPVIVRNGNGHVIDVFCKEKSNGSIQP